MADPPKRSDSASRERVFRVWLEAYLDGTLSERGVREMENLLVQTPHLRQVFVEVALQDQVAHRLFRADDVLELVGEGDAGAEPDGADLDRSIMAGLVEDALRARRLQEIQEQAQAQLELDRASDKSLNLAARRAKALQAKRDGRPMQPPGWVVWGSMAALLIFGVWIGTKLAGGDPPAQETADQGDDLQAAPLESVHIARVRDTLDARWSGQRYRHYFHADQPVTLESGLAEVVFGDGTTVVFEGPVTFEPTSRKGLRLVSGRLTARVPEGVTGFQVATASGLVTDHGTEFGVSVGPNGHTLAHTFSGRITLAPPDGEGGWRTEQEIDLLAGDAAESSPAGQIRTAQPDALTFVREVEFDARRNADASPYARWSAYRYQLQRDPDVVAYYTFDQEDAAAGALLNHASGAGVAGNGRLGNGGEIAAPRWAAGRFAATRSLRFGDAGNGQTYGVVVPDSDALDLEDEMTFALWVRATDPAAFSGTLLSKREVPTQRMNYQLAVMPEWHRGGRELQFGAGQDDDSTAGFAYSPMSGRLALPGWHHLVIVTDGQTIRYYIDGQPAHSQTQPQPTLVNDATLLIGTSPADLPASLSPGVIPFHGDISEILIAKRAFNETEIQALYDNSRATP